MKLKQITLISLVFGLLVFAPSLALAQTRKPISTQSPEAGEAQEATESAEIEPTPRPDITQPTEETLGPLEKILEDQELGSVWPFNPIKYAIRGAVDAGVAANTIVLLLLLPLVATIIAASRHLVGLRGFGIFLPAALAVTFVATGPVMGIGLFLVIVSVSVAVRMVLRKLKIKLQYLPRMAMMLLFVVFGVLAVLFMAPVIKNANLGNVGNVNIFPILILVLLAEDFSKVQLGKSIKTAINITTETLVLALVSYIFLTLKPIQELALLNPEAILLSVFVVDVLLGKYVGLRFVELWRFKKLIAD